MGEKMDRHAFAHEYQKVYPRLWLLAAGLLGDPSNADDVVQEAMIVAFDRIEEFREGSNFAVWLSAIVRRLVSNLRRKAARRKTFVTDPGTLDQQMQPTSIREFATSGGLGVIEEEIDDAMFRVLKQLPSETCACLLLRVIDGLRYAEISELVGIPEGTAMSHVHRAKSFVRQRLQSLSEDLGGSP